MAAMMTSWLQTMALIARVRYVRIIGRWSYRGLLGKTYGLDLKPPARGVVTPLKYSTSSFYLEAPNFHSMAKQQKQSITQITFLAYELVLGILAIYLLVSSWPRDQAEIASNATKAVQFLGTSLYD